MKSTFAATYKSYTEFWGDQIQRVRQLIALKTFERKARLTEPFITPDNESENQKNQLELLQKRCQDLDQKIEQKIKATKALGEAIPTDILVKTFGLQSFEVDLIQLLLVHQIDSTTRDLLSRFHDSPVKKFIDIETALALLGQKPTDQLEQMKYFNEKGNLLQKKMVSFHDTYLQRNFFNYEIKLNFSILSNLVRDGISGDPIRAFSKMMTPKVDLSQVVLPAWKNDLIRLLENHESYQNQLAQWEISADVAIGKGLILFFSGPSGTGKTLFAQAISAHLKRPLLGVDVQKLLEDSSQFSLYLNSLFFEAKLHRAIIFFDDCEALLSRGASNFVEMRRAFELFDGIIILATNSPDPIDSSIERRIHYHAKFTIPDSDLREQIWRQLIPKTAQIAPDVHLPTLANRFEFSGGNIRNALSMAINKALVSDPVTPQITMDHFTEAAMTQLRSRLSELTTENRTNLNLSDLILQDDTMKEVIEIVHACRNHSTIMNKWGFNKKLATGRGLVVLFEGEPGTGKTLCAEILANEINKTLYRINLPQIVSKYVGDTEKNIAKVFSQARANHSILLFDEADSLFSSRVKVESAQDRFANMETNQLLQEIERFDGFVVLTTNLITSIDSAFQRRINFKVTFPFPEPKYREKIWKLLIPTEAPCTDDIDFEALGEMFELSGGYIKNAIMRAAFMAADHNEPICMKFLVQTAKKECKSAGKLFRSVTE